jgi:lactoylglutathione lyase
MQARFMYIGIRVKEITKSVEFYTGLFDMKEKDRSRIEETKGDVVSLTSADGKLELELNHYDNDSPYYTKYEAGEGLDHLAFAVPNLDAALDEAKRRGVRVLREVKTKTSRWAYIEDPNGIWIELVQG